MNAHTALFLSILAVCLTVLIHGEIGAAIARRKEKEDNEKRK